MRASFPALIVLVLKSSSAFVPASRVAPTVTMNRGTSRGPAAQLVAFMQFPRLPFLQRGEESVSDDLGERGAVGDSFSANATAVVAEADEKLSETDKLLKQVKDAGLAGVISYASWELAFWAVSLPVVLFGYYEVTGHWPDLADKDDIAKLSAEAFAFVNFARFAVPLRIGLALSTTPWVQENIVDRFLKKEEDINGDKANRSLE